MIFSTIHVILSIFGLITLGCFIYSTSFTYIATLRFIFFSILSDMLMMPVVFIFGIIDFFSFFCFKNLCISQLYTYNIYFLGLYFIFILLFIFAIDAQTVPFDYTTAEAFLLLLYKIILCNKILSKK